MGSKARTGLALLGGRWSYQARRRWENRYKVQFKAAGPNVPAPVPVGPETFFEQDPVVTVQLWNSEGMCWSAEFDTAIKKTGVIFKTKRKIIVR